ncbi:MAG: Glycosyl transferase, group 1 [Candidatus Berkelbacteria bacterium Licking1014_7]|uniref:Glycosyl transferase, group 1 n=1 Tax=Candidatus Berkelbacteria bacterium Licking1014_7 TaxID=2017147 RepID=A0A554LJ77_9BACT|nr:MAG: Glycosyl transferase, group 1 [Candidatus Berkelbacteria bacterium Licking1014_7]
MEYQARRAGDLNFEINFMLIGIDASRAIKNQPTGTEYYCQEIIKALARIDRKNFYILYAPEAPRNELKKLPDRFSWRIIPFPRLWSQIRLSWELLTTKTRPDVMFEPAHTVPLIHTAPMVVTIHDLGFKYYPELYTRFENFYHNFSAKFSTKHSAHIITVSNYSASDIQKNYPVKPSKISVVYHGIDEQIFRLPNLREQKTNLIPQIKKPYIFYIGRLEKKKNITNLVKAYALLRQEKKITHQLVLTGKPGFGYNQIQQEIDQLSPEISKDIIQTGYIRQNDYPILLKNADIFAFVSNFEGFGMPVIEAFACGVPVVCSNRTSLPEIAQNAAILINPKKPFEIAVAFSKIINKPALKSALISKGIKRASLFSWDTAARKTLNILEMIGKKNKN